MSTILKALRRLEEDRSARSQRPLREQVTHGGVSAKPRRGGWPLLLALAALGLAVGGGALAFWVMGRAPEPAQPTELAAAGSAEPPAASKRPRKPRRPRSTRPRSSPSPAAAPSTASESELPAAALTSKVEMLKRPPAQPRIAAGEPAGLQASERTSGAPSRSLDPEEIPGRHRRPAPRASSGGAPALAARAAAPGSPGGPAAAGGAVGPGPSQAATAGPGREASRRPPAATEPEVAEFRAEPPREAVSEPVAVAEAPEPERAAPEPRAASGPAPKASSKQAAKPATAAAREPEPGETASREIARAEIPGLRVERTVWHPIAERRTALIQFDQGEEHREIREGDAVGPLVVSKIEPSGVVFVYQGVEVRRRVGE